MKHGFIKVAAGTPKIQVANCKENVTKIIEEIGKMKALGAKVMVLPELCISGFECRDLFWQQRLIDGSLSALETIAEKTADVDSLIFVGLPMEFNGKLFNCAAALNHGKVLGIIPKTHIPTTTSSMRQGISLKAIPGRSRSRFSAAVSPSAPTSCLRAHRCLI